MNAEVLEQVERVAGWLREADAVLIGAGAGLSAAAGYDYTDRAAFARNYPGMLQYGFRSKMDLMGRGDLPEELLWGYYLPHAREVRFSPGTNPLYGQLRELVEGVGEYFVSTTNADGLFERNGFPRARRFTPQGDYARVQCLTPCSDETWETQPLFDRFLPRIDRATQRLPKGEVPRCPKCGGSMFLNVRGGEWFVDAPWRDGFAAYEAWLARHAGGKLVVLDIGSGFNTPTWIRWPAEKLVRRNPQAHLVRLNRFDAAVPGDLEARSASFAHDAAEVLGALWARRPVARP